MPFIHLKWPLWSIRLGSHCFKVKPTKDELFSERNGYWHALRIKGISFLHQRIKQ